MYIRYDDEAFFNEYANMPRSRDGLKAAGEWHQLKNLFPDLSGKSVLDLGCGYGWHCKYAAASGAENVLGIDLSRRMIDEARRRNPDAKTEYRVCGIEEYDYPENSWDCVISNLALHYISDIESVFKKVRSTLRPGGVFIFNIEHPVFTSGIGQDWLYSSSGSPECWPVDNYFIPGPRETLFLGCPVLKYHHTLTQILSGLLENGFRLDAVCEAQPPENMMDIPGMKDELRRPMMLLVKAVAEK